MNLYENVNRRADHTLSALVKLFSFPVYKQDAFHYKSGDTKNSGWQFRYIFKKRWISRVYKLEISYSFRIEVDNLKTDFHLLWVPSKRKWRSNKKENKNKYIDSLNGNREIISKLSKIDLEKAEIKKKNSHLLISLVPIPGCFVWTLIPPLHYYVRLKPEEVENLTLIIKDLECSLNNIV